MNRERASVFLLGAALSGAVLSSGCGDSSAPAASASASPPKSSATASAKPSASVAPSAAPSASSTADAPIACKTDADCGPPPCGPCDPGTVLTKKDFGIECFRNPCKAPAAVCNPDHVCAVSPKTSRDPAVFGSASASPSGAPTK